MESTVTRCGQSAAVLWIGVMAVGVLVAGCSAGSSTTPPQASDGQPGAQPSALSSAPSQTSPADAARQGAITAYLGMWEDMATAGETSNWQDPRLGLHATATALTNITRGLYADKANGLVSKGRPKNSPQASSMEPLSAPTKVIIEDCGDSTAWLHYRADTGKPADDSPGGRRQINAVVEKQSDGFWRVTDFGVHEVGTC